MGEKTSLIGGNIKALRRMRNLTQVQLARKIGVPQEYIARWEKGVKPSVDYIKELSIAMNVDTMDITAGGLGWEEDVSQIVKDNFPGGVEETLSQRRNPANLMAKALQIAIPTENTHKLIVTYLEKIIDILGEKEKRTKDEPILAATYEKMELVRTIPDMPSDLTKDDKVRWEKNATALRRWSKTDAAQRSFPEDVPGWALERFCREAFGYERGNPKSITDILWDYLKEEKK